MNNAWFRPSTGSKRRWSEMREHDPRANKVPFWRLAFNISSSPYSTFSHGWLFGNLMYARNSQSHPNRSPQLAVRLGSVATEMHATTEHTPAPHSAWMSTGMRANHSWDKNPTYRYIGLLYSIR